jgi:hypothetical protein
MFLESASNSRVFRYPKEDFIISDTAHSSILRMKNRIRSSCMYIACEDYDVISITMYTLHPLGELGIH